MLDNEEQEDIDIVTLGCNHLQRRNKLKGIAMQKLILESIETKEEDLSLKKILKLVSKKIPEYYIVKIPIKTQRRVFNIKHEFVHISEFDKELSVYIREKIISKKWKECSYCGQFILASKQTTKKCRKCGKGYFKFITKKYNQWNKEYVGKREDVLKKLCEDRYLKQVTRLNKRADFFYYSDGVFYIYESKNKEISGLNFNDLIHSLIYPILLKKCNYKVKELMIIYNGLHTEELVIQLREGYADKFDFNINFSHIKKYLENRNIFVKEVVITKIDGKYNYKINYGETDQIKIKIELGGN